MSKAMEFRPKTISFQPEKTQSSQLKHDNQQNPPQQQTSPDHNTSQQGQQQQQQTPQQQTQLQQQQQTPSGPNPLAKKASLTNLSNVKTHFGFTNIWKFWLVLVSSQQNSRQYQIEEIFTFKALDYFYHYFHALPKLSELRNVNNKNISLALFKDSIKPAWEDERNKDGGYYSFTISLTENREIVDNIWFYMLLRIIGNSLQEEFKDRININGIYMKLKPKNNAYDMQIWVGPQQKGDKDLDTIFINNVADFCKEISGYDFRTYKPSPVFIPFQSKRK